ncbi:unnamed protein product [Victoria cruziana]
MQLQRGLGVQKRGGRSSSRWIVEDHAGSGLQLAEMPRIVMLQLETPELTVHWKHWTPHRAASRHAGRPPGDEDDAAKGCCNHDRREPAASCSSRCNRTIETLFIVVP